jgi:hypothetical protein
VFCNAFRSFLAARSLDWRSRISPWPCSLPQD